MLNVHLPEIMKGTLQTGNHNNKAAQKGQHRRRSLVFSGERRLRTVIFLLIPVRTPATAKTNARSCFSSLILNHCTQPLSYVAQMNKKRSQISKGQTLVKGYSESPNNPTGKQIPSEVVTWSDKLLMKSLEQIQAPSLKKVRLYGSKTSLKVDKGPVC